MFSCVIQFFDGVHLKQSKLHSNACTFIISVEYQKLLNDALAERDTFKVT